MIGPSINETNRDFVTLAGNVVIPTVKTSHLVQDNGDKNLSGEAANIAEFVEEWIAHRDHEFVAECSWNAWCQYLQDRTQPEPVQSVLRGERNHPALWGLPQQIFQSLPTKAIDRLFRNTDPKPRDIDGLLTCFQSHANHSVSDPAMAVAAVCLAGLLPKLATRLGERNWCQLVGGLDRQTREADVALRDDPWLHQMIWVELPLTLGCFLPEFDHFVDAAEDAIDRFVANMEEVFDGDGLPASAVVGTLRPLLASWIRCRRLIENAPVSSPTDDHQMLFEWTVHQSMRMMRGDGTQLLVPADDAPWNAEMFQAAVGESTDPDDARLGKYVFPGSKKKLAVAGVDASELSSLSEWGGVAILQSDWSRLAHKVGVAFPDGNLFLDICRNKSLLFGAAMPSITHEGRELSTDGSWEVACWHTDHDVQFVELEVKLNNGAMLSRQILLAREEAFLFLADAVQSREAGQIDYQLALPFAAGVQGMAELETREIYLTRKDKIQSLVMPLAIPEWNTARTHGGFECDAHGIRLSQMVEGCNLYAPIFLDLDPKRSRQPRTWRQLTVAEHLKILDRDTAVAFRVRVQDDQWMFYRSLANKGNRTFLGQNVACEFFVGKLTKDGEVEELISID